VSKPESIGVIGAGLMGAEIAFVFALAGHSVLMTDRTQEAVDAGVARLKYVTPGQLDDGLRVIKNGLVASDRVIVNGLMHVRPGIKVNARDQNTPAPPAKSSKPGDEAKAG